jgi:TonB family protein
MFDTTTAAKGRSTRTLVLSLTIHVSVAFALLMVHFTVETGIAPVRHTRVLLVPTAIAPRMKRAIRTPPKAREVRMQAALPPPRLPTLAPPVVHVQPVIEARAIVAEAPPKPPPVTPVAAVTPSPKPPALVQTGGFSGVSSTPALLAKATQVVAAGFGDAGTPPSAGQQRPSSVAAAGFGDTGVSSSPRSARAAVRSSGFGDAVSAAPSARGARPDAPPAVTIAQILEKPRPAYSEEARRLQIEGEVQLEILFGASGEVRILRVVRGLGHGLDENAVQAARTIRFLPARKDGRPVDSTATVHIIFQLAS